VAASHFERRIDAHVGRGLDRLMNGEQRRDLDDAADRGDADNRQHERNRLALQPVMKTEDRHRVYSPGCNAGMPATTGSSGEVSRAASGACRMVIQML